MDDFNLGPWDPSTQTLPNMFSTALSFGTLQVPQAPNTLETVPVNALQSMQPVSQAGAQSWSGFWQDITRGVVGYAVARDAAMNGLQPARTAGAAAPVVQAVPVQRAQAGIPPVLLLILGGAILLARK